MNKLTHSQPAHAPRYAGSRPVIIQINLDVSLLFWPLYALLWLGWLTVRGAVGALGRLWELGRAIAVVSGRRFRRWLRGNERRIEWMISGLLWGPVMGVG